MTREIVGTAVLLLATLIAASSGSALDSLDQRSRAALAQAANAHQQGRSAQVLQLLSPAFNRWKTQEATDADRWLKAVGMPSALEILLENRLQLSSDGRSRIKPTPGRSEAIGLLRILDQRIDRRMERRNQHPALQSPPVMPADFVEYRRFAEDLHYLKLELDDAVKLANLAEQLSLPFRSKRTLSRLSEAEQKLVRRDFDQQAEQFEQWGQEIYTRDLELRVNRIRDAASVLRLSKDIRERFLAAHAVSVDAAATTSELVRLQQIQRTHKKSKSSTSSSFDAEAARVEIEALVEASQKHLGHMPRKAALLEEGIYWWLRGRYGIGPLQMGRLKPPSTDLVGRLTVQMPLAPLTIQNGVVQTDNWKPLYPRRVHYMWQQDNRGIRVRMSASSGPQEQVTEVHNDVEIEYTHYIRSPCGGSIIGRETRFEPDYSYTIAMPVTQRSSVIYNTPEDVYRQVGYLEYNEALRRFDELLPLLSTDELKAVEEIVESDPRLTIEINLSRKLANGGALPQAPQKINDDFRRRGLRWLIALARIEVAGIAAGLTELPNPFLSAKTTPYELSAYQELVADAFRVFDFTTPPPAVWEQVREQGATKLLAFHRRQTMTLQLAEATSRLKLDPAQRAAVTASAAKALAIKSQLDIEVQQRTRMRTSSEGNGEVQRKSETPGVKSRKAGE